MEKSRPCICVELRRIKPFSFHIKYFNPRVYKSPFFTSRPLYSLIEDLISKQTCITFRNLPMAQYEVFITFSPRYIECNFQIFLCSKNAIIPEYGNINSLSLNNRIRNLVYPDYLAKGFHGDYKDMCPKANLINEYLTECVMYEHHLSMRR